MEPIDGYIVDAMCKKCGERCPAILEHEPAPFEEFAWDCTSCGPTVHIVVLVDTLLD